MTTRKRTLGIVTVCLLAVSALIFQTYRTLVKGGCLDDVAKLVPDDALLFIASRGAGDLSLEFAELGAALSEAGPYTQDAMELVTEVSTGILGFDPLSMDGWKSSGISFFHPIGYATFEAVDAFRGDALIFLPIDDQASLTQTVTQMVESLGGVVDVEELPTRQVWETHGANIWGKDVHLAWIIEDNFLVASLSLVDGFAPVPRLMELYGDNEHSALSDLDSFKSISRASSDDWHHFGYVSTGGVEDYAALMRRGSSPVQQLGLPLPSSRPFGFYTHLNDDQLSVSLVVTDLPDTVASALSPLAESGVDRFSDQLNINPVFIGRLSLSIEEIWQTTVSLDPSIEAIANSGLSVLGVDFEKDILENVNGDVSIIIGSEVAQDNLPTTVIHAEVRNPSPLESLVQSACPMLLTHMGFSSVEGDEGTACESEFGSFGILDRYIIASNNPGIVRGDLTPGGLTTHLPQAAWQQQLEGAPLSMYLNVKGVMDVLSDGSLTSAINSNPFIDPSIGNQFTTYQPNIEHDALPIEGIGLSMSRNGAGLEITGHLYPTAGSFTDWIGSGLELVLSPPANDVYHTDNTERELASAVESLAGAVSIYHMFEGSYLSCGDNDVADSYRADPRQWAANQTLVDCLEGELEWSVSDAPPGVYWVTVTDPESNETPFVAHGLALLEEEFVYFQAGPNGQAVKNVP